jgi:integrase
MKNDAKADITIKTTEYTLRQLAKHADLNDPEAVKHYVANATIKDNKPASAETRNKWLFCYDNYCKANQIQWNKPYYRVEEKAPLIPMKTNVEAIINNASNKYTTIFTLLTETGCSPMELSLVTQQDIDKEQGIVSIRGTKGHASANYKLKQRTAEMLRQYLASEQQEKPFPNSKAIRQVWIDTRKRTAKKLHNPDLNKIPCKNLRNYSGAEFYKNLPIRDPIAVMRHLRHKKLETTMHYIRAIVLDYEEDDQWISRISTTIEEDAKLTENGFQSSQNSFLMRIFIEFRKISNGHHGSVLTERPFPVAVEDVITQPTADVSIAP